MTLALIQRSPITYGDTSASATGSWYSRVRGPVMVISNAIQADYSCDFRGQINVSDNFNTYSGSNNTSPYYNFVCSIFGYLNGLPSNDGTNGCRLIDLRVDTDASTWFAVHLMANGHIGYQTYLGGIVDTGVSLTSLLLGNWGELRLASGLNAGNYWFEIATRSCTSSSFTVVTQQQAAFNIWQGWQHMHVGNLSNGGSGQNIPGRMFYVFATIGGWSDRQLLLGDSSNWTGTTTRIDAPPTPPYEFVVDATDGNDSTGNGTSVAPWQSGTKLTTEAQYGGLFGAAPGKEMVEVATGTFVSATQSAATLMSHFGITASQVLGAGGTTGTGYLWNQTVNTSQVLTYLFMQGVIAPNGDRVIFTSDGGGRQRITGFSNLPWPGQWADSDVVDLGVAGINLPWNGSNQTWLSHAVVCPSGTAVLESGTTRVYSWADTANAATALWEDGKAMLHVAGANFAAVKATMDAGLNNYYADGTKRYCVASDGSNPASNGRVYERDQVNTTGVAGIFANFISGIRFTETLLCQQTVNGTTGAWPLGVGCSSDQFCAAINISMANLDKHGPISQLTGVNSHGGVGNADCDGLSPYVSFGGANAYESFVTPIISATTNSSAFISCRTTLGNAATFGSLTYYRYNDYQSLYVHGGDTTSTLTNLGSIGVTNCDFTAGGGGATSEGGAKAITSVTGSIIRDSWDLNSSCSYVNSTISISTTNIVLSGLFDHCLWTYTGNTGSGAPDSRLTGKTAIVNHCTIDLRLCTGASVWYKTSAAANSITWTNNAVLLPTAGMEIIAGGGFNFNASELTAAYYNTYQGNASTNLYEIAGAGKTLAQMQALSPAKETGSTMATNIRLSASYVPLQGSPAIRAASDGTNAGAIQYALLSSGIIPFGII